MLNAKLKHHLAGLHAVSHEVSTYIYIYIYWLMIDCLFSIYLSICDSYSFVYGLSVARDIELIKGYSFVFMWACVIHSLSN